MTVEGAGARSGHRPRLDRLLVEAGPRLARAPAAGRCEAEVAVEQSRRRRARRGARRPRRRAGSSRRRRRRSARRGAARCRRRAGPRATATPDPAGHAPSSGRTCSSSSCDPTCAAASASLGGIRARRRRFPDGRGAPEARDARSATGWPEAAATARPKSARPWASSEPTSSSHTPPARRRRLRNRPSGR